MWGKALPDKQNGQIQSKDGDQWESFKGKGEMLAGRKTKGKGISHRKIEQVPEGCKIIRTDNRKIVAADTLDIMVEVPAALNLPFGQLFFGFTVTPYTLPAPITDSPGTQPYRPKEDNPTHLWGSGGHTLGSRSNGPVGAGGPRAAADLQGHRQGSKPSARTVTNGRVSKARARCSLEERPRERASAIERLNKFQKAARSSVPSSNRKIVAADTLDTMVEAPAALNLPFGQLFFGFNVTPYTLPAPITDSPGTR
ncbi:hypothetical protein NMY22_g8728 [Coprinellus aureogranulatus]|nr:hypothetical protein NMY22_g8728 [Coprinellus aureogranulatus]